MSIQTPPTLLVLTAKRLLRDQASAITALEYLPAELFPDLFVLAYRSGHHCQLLKAMAQAWPFTVLPLGALMQHPPDHAPTSAMGLKAVFDALDVLLAQEIRPRQEQEEQRSFSQFLSQMLRLRHLRDLNMESPSFLRGRLDQMLRCLQTPLDKLSITHCQRLTHSDLTHLFQCPNLRQLKILDIFGISLAGFSPEPLRALLEAVAPTLQDLGLDNCGMADSQVEAIMPALSRCHQLSFFTISINNFSVATLEKLLRHTTGLHSLQLELYPVPLECYRTRGTVDQERVALIQAELTGILRELGQPRRILLATKHFRHREFYHVEFS
ncbi:PREDICTED: PRAME family member 8 [Myotis brandtii]|uniref:PRAME family member 8 n=1 Tax=Myotis brandtii TaxID=109478 RepID=UPI0003BB7AB6|nr:PREDICTED: PRAME family member 8 [Myotis brandtii]